METWYRRSSDSIENMESMTALSREQLEQLDKADLIELILVLQAQVAALSQQVQELEDQVVKTSRNSGKPPSSDGLKKPRTRSLRKKSGRKAGGQKGHPGHTLSLVEKPDTIVPHPVIECVHCHANLSDLASVGQKRRQVFDVPPVALEVTEHQAEIKHCPHCQQENIGVFPAHVTQPLQYGPRLKAQASYLNTYHFIPMARTSELLGDFYGHEPSPAFVGEANRAVQQAIDPALDVIYRRLIEADVVHFDESGMRVSGQTQWLHVAGTEFLTYYDVHPKRGKDAMQDIGILPHFGGRAMHDHWASYQTFANCLHGYCNVHHLRELQFVTDQYGQPWAHQMAQLLLDAKATVAAATENQAEELNALAPDVITQFTQQYDALIEQGLALNPPPANPPPQKRGRPKQSPPKNLLDRLHKHRDETLAFLHDFRIPFDNNLAERDVRMVKVKLKVSGAFRTPHGAKTFCDIRSYISTVRKQGQNTITSIHDALSGCPFLPFAQQPE